MTNIRILQKILLIISISMLYSEEHKYVNPKELNQSQVENNREYKFAMEEYEKLIKKYPGKKHFVNEAVEYIKQIWLDMGFKEMEGYYVQSAFWDLDALFVPQDHPAREMQDTFYLNGKAKLPNLLEKIKKVRRENPPSDDGHKRKSDRETARKSFLEGFGSKKN